MKVFYGCDGSGVDKKMGGGYVPYILISASRLWTGRKFGKFNPPMHNELFLDSGGFSFFRRRGEYPFSAKQLSELGAKLHAEYIAVMDYPCEPDVLRTNGMTTNYQRIDATIKNAKECLKHSGNWVMVVQGYTPKEYLYCADLIKKEGLETDVVAIGSLCVRKRISEIKKIVRLVRKEFPKAKLHGFGIDLRGLKDIYIRNTLYSVDTLAWHFAFRCESREYSCIRAPTEKAKLENFERYKSAVDKLLSGVNKVKKISSFV